MRINGSIILSLVDIWKKIDWIACPKKLQKFLRFKKRLQSTEKQRITIDFFQRRLPHPTGFSVVIFICIQLVLIDLFSLIKRFSVFFSRTANKFWCFPEYRELYSHCFYYYFRTCINWEYKRIYKSNSNNLLLIPLMSF